jgi:hypothetical protein
MFKSFLLKKKIILIKNALNNLSIDTVKEKVDLNIVKNLWKNQKVIFWLKSHGIELINIPPFSTGGSGVAYFLPNNMVIKLTDDIVEANVAIMLIKSKLKHTFLDVMKLGNFYLILQNKLDLKNTSNEIKTAADLVTVLIDDYSLEEFPEDENLLKKMCLKTLKENSFPFSLLSSMLLVIKILKEIENNTGFFHDDAGPTNIGTKDKETYVFDLGPNNTRDYKPEERMKKINKKRSQIGLKPHKFI